MPTAAFPRAVLCVGPDRWLKIQALERLRSRLLSPGFEETDFAQFSEPSADPRTVLEALETAPFGSSCRLVVIDGLEEISADSVPWLAAHLDRAVGTGCAVVCGEKIAAGFPPARSGGGRLERISCQPLKGRELEEWMQVRAGKSGKTLEPAAVQRLLQRLGSNLQALDQAVESLSLLAGEAERITDPEVRKLIPASVRESAFDILDSAAAGRPSEAIRALQQAVGQGELTMDQFFGAVGWYYRNAWKNRRLARKGVTEALDDLLKSDVRLKQGHPDPELLASRLLLKLSGQPGLPS